jgi:hypothetical protein
MSLRSDKEAGFAHPRLVNIHIGRGYINCLLGFDRQAGAG